MTYANDVTGIPVVSWLICSNCSNQLLKEALASCLNQTYEDFEIIFVANGPNADEIAWQVNNWFGQDARVRVHATPVNYLNFSLNLGLHYARGTFIARMDADDISYPDRLLYQVGYLTQNSGVSILGSFYDLIDENNAVIGSVKLPIEDEKIRATLTYRNPICHPSVMLRRDILIKSGGYLGGLYAEDYDLWVRLSNIDSINFHNFPKALIGYRTFGSGARGTKLAYGTQLSTQVRQFVLGYGVKWLFGALMTFFKLKFISE